MHARFKLVGSLEKLHGLTRVFPTVMQIVDTNVRKEENEHEITTDGVHLYARTIENVWAMHVLLFIKSHDTYNANRRMRCLKTRRKKHDNNY